MSWSRQIAMLPVIAMMATVIVPEEIKMEGDLQDEFSKLLKKYMPNMRFRRNNGIVAYINTTYPEQSNLWTILDGILNRYHLRLEFTPIEGTLELHFEKGFAWTH